MLKHWHSLAPRYKLNAFFWVALAIELPFWGQVIWRLKPGENAFTLGFVLVMKIIIVVMYIPE